MSWKIINAEFLLSAAKLDQLPNSIEPELAIIGRSNAGKSTLVNRLCQRKSLAKVSATPGKTQQINLFLLTLSNGHKERKIRLADLPGYGYASVSKRIHEQFIKLVADYFENRAQLKLVLLLSDCKRTANDIDLSLVNYLRECEKDVRVILTKTDKLNQKELSKSVRENSQAFGCEPKELYQSGTAQAPTILLQKILGQFFDSADSLS